MFELERFIREHLNNWEEVLSSPPYNLKISHDGKLVIFKYNQIASDLSLPICQQARGSIYEFSYSTIEKVNSLKKEVSFSLNCVCRPFDKFFNYGEAAAAPIDFSTASVQEKIDGSLIKLYWYNGSWRIATNGTINAFSALVGDTNISFGDLFLRTFNYDPSFFNCLDTHYTYMFELAANANHLVVSYKDEAVYYLGRRENKTGIEDWFFDTRMLNYGIRLPRRFKFNSIEEIVNAANILDLSQEGFVVCDANFNRVKIKGTAYLVAAKADNNGVLGYRKIVELIKNEALDDFLAIAPQHKEKIDEVRNALLIKAAEMEENYPEISAFYSENGRRLLAISGYSRLMKNYLFARIDGKAATALEYLLNSPADALLKTIGIKN